MDLFLESQLEGVCVRVRELRIKKTLLDARTVAQRAARVSTEKLAFSTSGRHLSFAPRRKLVVTDRIAHQARAIHANHASHCFRMSDVLFTV